MKNNSIQKVVATGIGAALFVVIGLLVNIPTPIPNTSIQLQYGIQALLAILYGPVVGFLIGFIGHAIKDSLQYGPWWTWIIASGSFGFIIGLLKNHLKIEAGFFDKKAILTFNLVQLLANLILWLLVAPVLDILFYAEPANKVFIQGLVAALVNAFTVSIAGTLLIAAYTKNRTQANSLSKE